MKLAARNPVSIFVLLACLAVSSARADAPLPDLTVTVVTISPVTVEAGDPLTMAVVLSNNGLAPAAASVAKIVLSTDDTASADDHLLMQFNIPALEPRQSFTFTLTTMIPANITAGEYYVCVTANADGAINESDTSNNTAVAVLHIGGASPLPDLSASAMTISKAHAEAGEEFIAVVNVTNQGSGNAPASVTEFRFGTSPNLTRNDTLLGFQTIGELVAGESHSQTAVLNVPSGTQPGTYYVGAFVNANSAFDEVTYTNNLTTVSIVVSGGQVEMFTLTVTTAGTGSGTVTISPVQETYAYGDTIALIAIANPGSVFAGWSGDINSTGNALTLTIIANTTLVATFNLAEEINHAPIAVNGAFNGAPGVPFTGTLNASDEDGDALTFSIVNGPTLGTVTLSAAGGVFTYVAPENATGTDSFTFKANDGEFDSNIATITIALGERPNQPPLVASATVSPNPAVVGQTVTVTIVANDPDEDALTYTFNWGDGSASTSDNTHIYSAAGTYVILATVSDGEDMFNVTLTLVVTAPPAVEVKPFALQKFNAKFRFDRPAADCCNIMGALPNVPAGLNFAGKTFSIDVGGVVRNFTLNARGRAETADGSLSVKYQRGRNGSVALGFNVKLKGNLASHWADEGVDPAQDAFRQAIQMDIGASFDGTDYAHDAHLILNVRAHRGGTLND